MNIYFFLLVFHKQLSLFQTLESFVTVERKEQFLIFYYTNTYCVPNIFVYMIQKSYTIVIPSIKCCTHSNIANFYFFKVFFKSIFQKKYTKYSTAGAREEKTLCRCLRNACLSICPGTVYNASHCTTCVSTERSEIRFRGTEPHGSQSVQT